MDFFERQEKAHRNTKLLVVYFVTGVALLIYLVAAGGMLPSWPSHRSRLAARIDNRLERSSIFPA
jgi:hypothetical protein